MAATIALLMLYGLPTKDPEPLTTGTRAAPGQPVRLITDSPDPTLTGSLRDRVTGKRFEKAGRVVVNPVVFRFSGQGLTTTGTYVEMGSRLAEPVLLGSAPLAVRGRIKR